MTRRKLLSAWMLERPGERRRAWQVSVPPIGRPRDGPGRPEARIEALTKLKSLFETGVLTRQQYESERHRLLDG